MMGSQTRESQETSCIRSRRQYKEVDVFEMRKRIGMVFQRPNPFSKSIYDNIAFALRRHGERNKRNWMKQSKPA